MGRCHTLIAVPFKPGSRSLGVECQLSSHLSLLIDLTEDGDWSNLELFFFFCIKSLKRNIVSLAVVAHTFDPST